MRVEGEEGMGLSRGRGSQRPDRAQEGAESAAESYEPSGAVEPNMGLLDSATTKLQVHI